MRNLAQTSGGIVDSKAATDQPGEVSHALVLIVPAALLRGPFHRITNGNPSTDADWTAALEAYNAAARLGSYAPEAFRPLAITDEHLSDHASAVAAARRAVELDRYDPVSQALLATLTGK